MITKIGHDSEGDIHITGYTSSKPFARTLNYEHGVKYEQVREIVDGSVACVTLQTYDCKGKSYLLLSNQQKPGVCKEAQALRNQH